MAAGSQFSSIDEYGFMRSKSFDLSGQEEFMKSYLRVLSSRAQKWDKIVKRGYDKMERGIRLKRYIRKGIPSSHRRGVWMEMSGAGKMKKEEPDLFSTMLNLPTNRVVLDQIVTDMPRTFPNNVNFDSTNPNSMQKPLLNILTAFANSNPTIGYCQGLNYIAGLLLLATRDQDSSFWLLKALTEKILPDYYSPSMPGLTTDFKVLAEISRKDVPLLARHIDGLQMPWALICSKWFICLYAEVLPTETVLRVWDCLFAEGSKVLFRVALTILKIHEKEFLEKRDFADLMEEFKRFYTSQKVLNCHSFLEKVYQNSTSLSRSKLAKLRVEFGNQTRIEQIERDNRRKEMNK